MQAIHFYGQFAIIFEISQWTLLDSVENPTSFESINRLVEVELYSDSIVNSIHGEILSGNDVRSVFRIFRDGMYSQIKYSTWPEGFPLFLDGFILVPNDNFNGDLHQSFSAVITMDDGQVFELQSNIVKVFGPE